MKCDRNGAISDGHRDSDSTRESSRVKSSQISSVDLTGSQNESVYTVILN